MDIKLKKCETCRWYEPLSSPQKELVGYCHLSPPKDNGFPKVLGDVDWCSNHQRKM